MLCGMTLKIARKIEYPNIETLRLSDEQKAKYERAARKMKVKRALLGRHLIEQGCDEILQGKGKA